MRAFISIDISEEIKKEIIKIQEKLPEFLGKKTEPENLHLTLKFLGEIEEKKIEEIKNRLSEIKFSSFEASINSIGFFDRGSEKYAQQIIIWLHMTNCEKLQKLIDEKLRGIFDPEKRFMSHLTIARVKSVKDKKKFIKGVEDIEIPNLDFIVKKFSLKKSNLTSKGPVYEDIGSFNLIREKI